MREGWSDSKGKKQSLVPLALLPFPSGHRARLHFSESLAAWWARTALWLMESASVLATEHPGGASEAVEGPHSLSQPGILTCPFSQSS